MNPKNPLRLHTHYQDSTPGASSYAGGSSFMERMSEAVASGMGTVAFYTGALVIIAQKAQTRTDKANEVAAAAHRDELSETQSEMLRRNTDLTEQIHLLAEQLTALTTEVHRATCHGPVEPVPTTLPAAPA